MSIQTIDAMRGYEFWRDGCHTFAKNMCWVFKVAQQDWDKNNLLRFVQTLPVSRLQLTTDTWKQSYCSLCLEKAYENDPKLAKEAVDYFINYFTDRHWNAQLMLIDAFIGVIGGVDAYVKELESRKNEPKAGS